MSSLNLKFPPSRWSLFLLAVFLLSFSSCDSNDNSLRTVASPFPMKRGTNVSHWLSQNDIRGEERRAFFTREDVINIASLGFDHIRIPIDEEQFWTAGGTKITEAFDLLHNAVKWSEQHNLKVIIDLHILRAHHFNEGNQPLWTNPAARENFLNMWRDLSGEFSVYPTALVAYELLNEPVANDPEQWNRLIERTLEVIRENEPQRVVVIGSTSGQSHDDIDKLRVPPNDKNLILSFHYYHPLLLTHYRAFWTPFGDYTGPVHYPGQVVRDEELAALPVNVAEKIKGFGAQRVVNKNKIHEGLQAAIRFANRQGLTLYCGEWGVLNTAPREDRLRWYDDVSTVLENNNIPWASWDYKSTGFGFTDGRGVNHDMELLEILTGN